MIMGIFEKFKEDQAQKCHLENQETASVMFQITEHDGEIWITFNGNLVCPSSMLNLEPVEAIRKMRELYIKRKDI